MFFSLLQDSILASPGAIKFTMSRKLLQFVQAILSNALISGSGPKANNICRDFCIKDCCKQMVEREIRVSDEY